MTDASFSFMMSDLNTKKVNVIGNCGLSKTVDLRASPMETGNANEKHVTLT